MTDEDNTYQGAYVILAVGRERRMLGLEHEGEWMGWGVSSAQRPMVRCTVAMSKASRRRRRGDEGRYPTGQVC